MIVQVRDIRKGDRLADRWVALGDAEVTRDRVVVPVQHLDGGRSRRVWDDPQFTLDLIPPDGD